jgi:hypothetical protein
MPDPRDVMAGDSGIRHRALRALGTRVVALGAVFGLVGFLLSTVCTVSYSGSLGSGCSQYGYGLWGYVTAIGIAFIIVGGAAFFYSSNVAAEEPPGDQPRTAFCNVCGQPLAWVSDYRRWYCSRCGEYR